MIARLRRAEIRFADPRLRRWVEAVIAADKFGDQAPLVKLMKSKTPLPHEVRRYLADLLERKVLRSAKRGNQRTPAYTFTTRVSDLLCAVSAVRYLRKKERKPRDEAIKEAAGLYGLRIEAVEAAYDHHDADLRRQLKARPGLAAKLR